MAGIGRAFRQKAGGLVYARSLADKRFVVALNLDDEPKAVRLPARLTGRALVSTHSPGRKELVGQRLDLAASEGAAIDT